MNHNQSNNLPVAEIIECNVTGQQTIMEIDGRLKFLRIGDKLYTQPSQVAQPEQTVEPVTIEIDFKQTTALLEMFGGEPASITLMLGDEHSGNGLYAHYTFLPEEGALYLGEADEDALPDAAIAQPEQPALKIGGEYNWVNQADRLVYLGKAGNWHQFKKIGDPRKVWCEVMTQDLRMIEEAAQPKVKP